MILQLTVFSLLLLFLMLVGQFIAPGGSAGGQTRFGSALSMGERGERINAVIRSASRTYLLFATLALYFYLQGKPELLPQYLGWTVVGIEVVRGYFLYMGNQLQARFLGVVNVAILIFLWVQELPIFQQLPA